MVMAALALAVTLLGLADAGPRLLFVASADDNDFLVAARAGAGPGMDGWTDMIMFPGDPQPSLAVKTDDTAGTFSNPLCGLGCDTVCGADPWIQMVGNATHHAYYWVFTSMPPLKMRKAATLAGLHSAPSVAVWSGPSRRGFWAPELHYWPAPYKTWYIYVVNNNNRLAYSSFAQHQR